MSIITAEIVNGNYYKNSFFGLLVNTSEHLTEITMEMFVPVFDTKRIPVISSILESRLPSVFHSACFNDYGLSFRKEVENTEVGHLFEHILLEYLSHLKSDFGFEDSVHNGLTKWNWFEDKRGVFHITIDAGVKDSEVLQLAIHQSVKLLSDILKTIPADIIRKRRPKKLPLPTPLYIDLR